MKALAIATEIKLRPPALLPDDLSQIITIARFATPAQMGDPPSR